MTYRQNIQRGVPDGLAVADAFDTMTIDRPNQKVMRTWEALNELREHKRPQLDR
jgi:HD-GYP domain-containing protein (c-di-GMP phosphodiesterase class II)